jgi:gluconate 5-dehydrogenase
MKELFDLSGRVAIVTGGSRGLGAEFAEGLAEAGASLMLCARRDEWLVPGAESLRAKGFTVHAMRCDVSDPADVQALVDATVERFGAIDILVNNAGVSWGGQPEVMTLTQWQKVIYDNLTGAFICSQAFGR